MDEILKIRLQGPAAADLVLVHRGQQRLEAPLWPARSHQSLKVGIEIAGARRNAGIAGSDAKFVLRPGVAQADEFDPAIGIEIDQVSIRRARRDPGEDADAAIVVMADSVDLLLENRIDAEIAGQGRGYSGAERTCQ